MLRQIVPRNARSKRALEKREPQITENPKKTLFLRGTSCSQVVQLALADLHSLKRPHGIKFNKKNAVHPFEDPSSLEFFAAKNDASLLVFGHHSKKRPHCLTFVRCFNAKILDLLELYIDPDSLRTLQQFKNTKCAVGLKPLLAFSGTLFESPTPNAYTLAKNLFLDYFGGHEAATVDVEGLQYLMQFCVGDEVDGQPAPKIHFRVFLIRTKKSGQKLPRVEVEEMGPRIDFRVGRIREAEESVWREALKKPKHIEPKVKKNIDTDIIGDKVGRIHIGKQNLSTLQTRKMKGLKRTRDAVDDDNSMLIGDEDGLNESNAKRERR